MGDRALVVFYDQQQVSPAVYLHWNGGSVPDMLADLAVYMKGRYGDAEYAAARFTGLCHNLIDGNLSLGIWSNEMKKDDLTNIGLLRDMSPGDAGVVIVNTDDFTWKAYGGYLAEYQRSSAASAQLTLVKP
jgi:hypothetical protein